MGRQSLSNNRAESMQRIASAMSLFTWAEEDSDAEWSVSSDDDEEEEEEEEDDSSSSSLNPDPESWEYEGGVRGSIFVTAQRVGGGINKEFGLNDAMEKMKHFYSLHDGSCDFDHSKLYKVYEETFDRHAQGLMYAYGTSITDMQDPSRRKKFNHEGMYFEFYRPHASLGRAVKLISMEALPDNPGIFAFVTEEVFAGRIVTTSFFCLAKRGKIFRIQHEEQWQDCRDDEDEDDKEQEEETNNNSKTKGSPLRELVRQDATFLPAISVEETTTSNKEHLRYSNKTTRSTSIETAEPKTRGDEKSTSVTANTSNSNTPSADKKTAKEWRRRGPLVLVWRIKDKLKQLATGA